MFTVLFPFSAQARIELVKSGGSGVVYYVDSQNVRHVFPSGAVYASWYGDDFSTVVTVSDEFLSERVLGKNVTMRPGSLVKIPSVPAVYAVEPGGILRKIASEEVAKGLYGKDWAKRVKDVPESFWQNYTIGKDINFAHEVPDGSLFMLPGETSYFYKFRGSIQPFSTLEAIEANNLSVEDVVVQPQTYFFRSRPIVEKEIKIVDPAYELISLGPDCSTTGLEATIIFVVDSHASQADLDYLSDVVELFPDVWQAATDDLSTLSISPDIFVIQKDLYNFTPTGEDQSMQVNLQEVAFQYFDEKLDDKDFLIVFNDFHSFSNRYAEYQLVTNDVKGNNQLLFKGGSRYGSSGKLKGIANLGNLRTFVGDDGFAYSAVFNLLLHELGHHWSGAVTFDDGTGEKSTALLREDDLAHWSDYVDFVSPLGSYGWEDLGGGTYLDRDLEYQGALRGFSSLDLYLMGLYPPSAVGEIGYLVPSEIDKVNNTIVATRETVSVDQIIDAHGEWGCVVK